MAIAYMFMISFKCLSLILPATCLPVQAHIGRSGEFPFVGLMPARERSKWSTENTVPKSACGLVTMHLHRDLQF